MSVEQSPNSPVAFFARRTAGPVEILEPLPLARSGWGAGQLRGLAVSAALARAVEHTQRAEGRGDLRPARWTLDLFRPAYSRPTTITTTVVRSGRRLCLIDATVHQDDDRPVARASALLLQPGSLPASALWRTDDHPLPPTADHRPNTERLFHDGVDGWLPASVVPAGNGPKSLWQYSIPTVVGEEPSKFQAVAGMSDLINAATNLGDTGLEFINADATVNLSRLPATTDVGMCGLTRSEHAGIVSASAVVFDAQGQFGAVTMSGLKNSPIAMELPRA